MTRVSKCFTKLEARHKFEKNNKVCRKKLVVYDYFPSAHGTMWRFGVSSTRQCH